jgi:hypothetical protein
LCFAIDTIIVETIGYWRRRIEEAAREHGDREALNKAVTRNTTPPDFETRLSEKPWISPEKG